MDLNKAKERAFKNAELRGLYRDDPFVNNTLNALKHCAGELLEAIDAYNLWTYEEEESEMFSLKENFENELADVITCILTVSEIEGVDIEKALERVFEKNEKRIEKLKTKLRTAGRL